MASVGEAARTGHGRAHGWRQSWTPGEQEADGGCGSRRQRAATALGAEAAIEAVAEVRTGSAEFGCHWDAEAPASMNQTSLNILNRSARSRGYVQ